MRPGPPWWRRRRRCRSRRDMGGSARVSSTRARLCARWRQHDCGHLGGPLGATQAPGRGQDVQGPPVARRHPLGDRSGRREGRRRLRRRSRGTSIAATIQGAGLARRARASTSPSAKTPCGHRPDRALDLGRRWAAQLRTSSSAAPATSSAASSRVLVARRTPRRTSLHAWSGSAGAPAATEGGDADVARRSRSRQTWPPIDAPTRCDRRDRGSASSTMTASRRPGAGRSAIVSDAGEPPAHEAVVATIRRVGDAGVRPADERCCDHEGTSMATERAPTTRRARIGGACSRSGGRPAPSPGGRSWVSRVVVWVVGLRRDRASGALVAARSTSTRPG